MQRLLRKALSSGAAMRFAPRAAAAADGIDRFQAHDCDILNVFDPY
jgi:hypothetical protein